MSKQDRVYPIIFLLPLLVAPLLMTTGAANRAEEVSDRARALHRKALVLDTHADTPQRLLYDPQFDIGARDAEGHIDIPRLREGGLDAVFFSIWVPSAITGPEAVKRSLRLIDTVHQAARNHPEDLLLATTAEEVRRAHREGKIAALLGMEGGHMIDDDLGVLRMYAALGVRYLTLTHFLNNNWADSSTDKPAHDGLTEFGREVVRELNRLGVMVDISHVSDKAFRDALRVTKAPVIASHSSSRAISQHPRNMTDDMLQALARNGGVIMINYHASFLSEEFRAAWEGLGYDLTTLFEEMEQQCGKNQACKIRAFQLRDRQMMAEGTLPEVNWEKIIEHIDHAVKVAGVDHVGLGSDFDGATMPIGMEDASKLPRITEALLQRGYSEGDVERILGLNLLRVMEQVERVSRRMRGLR